MQKKRVLFVFSFLYIFIATVVAQKLTANAPQQVAVGQQFRLSYTVNTQDVSGFRVGQIPDAFEVLMGPSQSSQSSFQIINGKTSQSSSITFTYILSATKNGTFTIPAATITAAGNQISSNTLKIVVSGQAQSGGAGSGTGRQRQQEPQMRDAGTAITGSDLFIRVSASKKHVVEQEPILLTYKVYTLVDLTQLEGKMPDLKGFHTQEVPLPQQKSFSVEQLNGRSYRTVTWSQYVMFPQITGKLQIPSITFNGVVVQRNRNVDPFEAFFNGGSGYIEVKKAIKAPGIDIEVDPLPTRPAGFSGGVGKFSISATIDKTTVKANDPINMRVVVSGVGNLKLIKEPVVGFPKDFDSYDAKLTDKSKLTTNGVEGNMIYDFLAVPRHQGEYDIPPIEFTYFDTALMQYKTVKTEGFHIHVDKGEGGSNPVQDFTGQEDIQLLAKDIRHIKQGESHQQIAGDYFFGSNFYWIAIALLLGTFISLFIIFRQRAIANADVVGSRASKANKVATKRLKKAEKLMKEGKKPGEFFDEVLRALWGYVGDKLSMPVTQLSRDNIRERLSERGVDDEIIRPFMEALDECEFQRYAPGDPKGNMNKVYDKAVTAIEKIESSMKKKKAKKNASSAARMLLLCVAVAASVSSAHALTKAEADSAYTHGNYQQAILLYDSLLKEGVSPEIYYNLGNAYYRIDDITHAVINYERALQLSPGDADIRFNLQMARSKTIDKIVPESEMFFVTWYRSLINVASVDGWAYTALAMLAFAVVLALMYLFANQVWLRKIGFFGAFFALVAFFIGNLFAWQQKQSWQEQRGAIIIGSAVTVKSTPTANGTDLFILHEGTKVTIVDNSMREWREIRVADGKQGWVEAKLIEAI